MTDGVQSRPGFELGLTTFAETIPVSGEPISHAERLRQVVEEIRVADEVGLDVYGVGEHHRSDFAASAPAVVLAAAASVTSRIRLTPAVSVLSSDDPVRVFQQYATLDAVSSGRAELLVGRGSFIESFPLFGYSLDDYEDLFTEKLDLLLTIRDTQPVTWSGRHRQAIDRRPVFPRPEQDPFPIWVAVGGSPESMVRAGSRGLPVALAIIGGNPRRFAVLGEIHRRALVEAGFDPVDAPLAVHAHGYVADTEDQAVADFLPPYAIAMTGLGRERGWGPMTRQHFDAMRSEEGSLLVGDPEQVAAKILRWKEILGISRFMLHISVGSLPHELVLRSIERFGREVAPIVRAGA